MLPCFVLGLCALIFAKTVMPTQSKLVKHIRYSEFSEFDSKMSQEVTVVNKG